MQLALARGRLAPRGRERALLARDREPVWVDQAETLLRVPAN